VSRVDWTPIDVNDARSVVPLNTLYTDVAASGAALAGVNFAEEGLDARSLAAHPFLEREELVVNTTFSAIVNSGAFVVLNMGANIRTGAIGAVLTDEWLRIRSLVWFATTRAAGVGMPAGSSVSLRHAWNNGAVTAKVANSERSHAKRAGLDTSLHAAIFIESWLQGPITDVAFVEVQYMSAGGPLHAANAVLAVTRYKRAGTL
jgi:hypothetical protein